MSETQKPTRVSKDLWAKLKPLAQEKRKNPTQAEKHLWELVRNRQIEGLKFRHQYIIENFIVDFYCAELSLVIEVDGAIHDYQQAHDSVRQERLEARGARVLRFRNEQVFNETASVIQAIRSVARSIHSENPAGDGVEE